MLVALNGGKLAEEPPSELATVRVDPKDGSVSLYGEIDFSNARNIFDSIAMNLDVSRHLVLDLAGLEFIDCSGMHHISVLAERLHRADRRLILLSPCGIVRRTLEVSHVDRHPGLTIHCPQGSGRRESLETPDRLVRPA